MKVDTVLESEAFRTINLQIDSHVEDIIHNMNLLKRYLSTDNTFSSIIQTRLHDEGHGKVVEVPFSSNELKIIVEIINDIVSKNSTINDLQRLKLRLINDPDFRGGEKEQSIIFGEKVE